MEIVSINPAVLVAVFFISMAGAILHGAIGFGVGAATAPFLVLVASEYVPGPLILAVLLYAILLAFRERKSIDFSRLRWALIGRVTGTALAGAILFLIDRSDLEFVIGISVLIAVAISAFGRYLILSTATLMLSGFLSGFMGTTASIGGPAIALIYQREDASEIRGTLSAFFIVGSTISLALLASINYFDFRDVILALTLVPGILVGYGISRYVTPWIDRGKTRAFILIISGVAGMVVILRNLV
jgi:uncharacterized membrane protein YfcA